MSKGLYSPDFFRQISEILKRLSSIERALFNSGISEGVDIVPTGVINSFAGNIAPTGFLLCDGSLVSRVQYEELFSVIGTAYGVGDGSTTFNLPDLRGRTPYGVGTHTDIDALGENDGEAVGSRSPKHALSDDEMPSHNHSISFSGQTFTNAGAGGYVASADGSTGRGGPTAQWSYTIGSSGNDIAHHHGYIVLNYIIKY